jgi:phage shock protein PspC (stress-responsive transcriptional regulator)
VVYSDIPGIFLEYSWNIPGMVINIPGIIYKYFNILFHLVRLGFASFACGGLVKVKVIGYASSHTV